MASSSKLLTEQVVEEAKYQLRKIGKAALISRKLEAVIAAKTHGISQVAKIYDITRTTLTSWIKHIQNGSIERLNAPAERKRKNKLNDMQRGQILEWMNTPWVKTHGIIVDLKVECNLRLPHVFLPLLLNVISNHFFIYSYCRYKISI